MAANLKGNLGLKSSPLAPTSCKLSTQYLVLDHMTNHYNKIAKAKSAIDSKPPKSFSTSQKMRDRRNRERVINSPRTRPLSSMSYEKLNEYQDFLYDEPEDEEERLVNSIMRSTLLEKPKASINVADGLASHMESQDPETHVSQQFYQPAGDAAMYKTTSAHPVSARSIRSGHSLTSSASRALIPTHDPTKITYKGDVLEKRPHLFTEPDRPFTPRTLKNNHESRLRNSKCYNPPRNKNIAKHHKSTKEENSGSERPRPPPRSRKQQEGVPATKELQDTIETSQLSESMLMDITLRSRDGRHNQEPNHNVPPLAISMDKDHMNWIKEQASKAEVRARSNGQLKSSLHSDEELQIVRTPHSARVDPTALGLTVKMESKKNPLSSFSTRSLASQRSTSMSWISQLLMEEEEEQKYLAFAKEVTDDVLSRGICADSVLHRVFENHIERRKHELDQNRMRKVIRNLRKDLGLRDSSLDRYPVASLSDVNYSNRAGRSTSYGSSYNGNIQQQNGSSKEESLSYSQMNMDTSTSLEPLNVMTSHSETSTTLDSTSTMKFGQTGDIFSTINSEATLEAEEAEREGLNRKSELTVTQALKQYEFNLTVKEASGDLSTSARDSEAGNSESSRPATGEKRTTAEEDVRSEAYSVGKGEVKNPPRSSQRTKRREMLKKSRDIENSSSAASQPSSEHGNSNEMLSSDNTVTNVVLPSENSHGSQTYERESAADDGDVSVKSSVSSQRPSVKPRRRVRQSHEEVPERERHYHQDTSAAAFSGLGPSEDNERGTELYSTAGSEHGNTVEEGLEAEKDAEEFQDHHSHPIEPSANENQNEDYEDDYEYEENYTAEEDEDQGGSTHRTSDDDF